MCFILTDACKVSMMCQQICHFGCLLLIIVITGCAEAEQSSSEESSSSEEEECPLGFTELGGSCYYFSVVKASYWEAVSACDQFDSHLAEITSKPEDDLIRDFALSNGNVLNYWLGGSDLRVEGTWTWEKPVRTIGYDNWSSGQPDNFGGKEHCLEIRRPFGNYLWNDFKCDVPSHYICETSK